MPEGAPPALLIRADANSQIGTGHVMRCLALSQAWIATGGTVAFLGHCQAGGLRERIESIGADFIRLDRPHPDLVDLRVTLATLDQMSTRLGQRPWLVLDGYHFAPDFQQGVRSAGYRLLVVDDTAHLASYHADLLLNQNLNAEHLLYQSDDDTLRLLGSRYVMLRAEFLAWRGWKRPIAKTARRILVTLGGADPDNVTLKVIQALTLLDIAGLEATVVVGSANPHFDGLQSLTCDWPFPVRLVRNAGNMPELMAWADVAVSGGGSTCWELAFMGLPTLAITVADNQRGVVRELKAAGVAVDLGWFQDVTAEQIASELSAICKDTARREEFSCKGPRIVDGHGPERIGMLMQGINARWLEPTQLHVRSAEPADAVALWLLAIEPTVRQNAFNSERFPLGQHMRWYQSRLGSPDYRFYVLELGGAVVAQARYNRVDAQTVEIDFSVAPALRGKGLGTQALALTWRRACQELGVRWAKGVVFTRNVSSVRAFLKAGFVQTGTVEERGHPCYVFQRECD